MKNQTREGAIRYIRGLVKSGFLTKEQAEGVIGELKVEENEEEAKTRMINVIKWDIEYHKERLKKAKSQLRLLTK